MANPAAKYEGFFTELTKRADELKLDSSEDTDRKHTKNVIEGIISNYFKNDGGAHNIIYGICCGLYDNDRSASQVIAKGRERITSSLKHLVEVSADPVTLAFECARPTEFHETRIFCSDTNLRMFNARAVVRGESFVETELVVKVRASLLGSPPDDVDELTHVIYGPSGSGKTTSVVALSRPAERAIVAYLLMPSLAVWKYEDKSKTPTAFGESISGKDVEHRNAEVLRLVVNELCATIPHEALRRLSLIPEPFNLIIFIDELGGEAFMPAVRGLCAQSGKTMKDTLCKRFTNMKEIDLSGITFRLCIAGSGIGTHGDGTTGSLPNSFRLIQAYSGAFIADDNTSGEKDEMERHEKTNRKVFALCSGIGEDAIEKLGNTLNPFLWRMISQNMRMAAILGAQLWVQLGAVVSKENIVDVLCRLDLTHFLAPAYLKFKRLNGLSDVLLSDAHELLLKVLRMHWFPHAHTVGADRMQSEYGLIVDRARVGDESATYSPCAFPFFTTGLLSMLWGCPVVTRSLTSGAALEEYECIVLHMLACAANDESLFLMALRHNKGRLVPMCDVRPAPKTRPTSANNDDDNANTPMPAFQHLPASKDRSFEAFIHQMEFRDDSNEANTSRYIDKILSSWLELLERFKSKDSSVYHVASLRSYDKAPFADSSLFAGSMAFFKQDKDFIAGYKGEKIEEERRKMGGDGAYIDKIFQLLETAETMLTSVECEKVGAGRLATAAASLELAKAKCGDACDPRVLCESLEKVMEDIRTSTATEHTDHATASQHIEVARKELSALRSCAERLRDPRRIIQSMIEAWYRSTGHQVTQVYRVFVTPTPVAASLSGAAAVMSDSPLHINVGGHSWVANFVCHGPFRERGPDPLPFI